MCPTCPDGIVTAFGIEHQVMKELGEKKKDLDTLAIRRLGKEYAEKFYKIQRDEFQRLGVIG